MRRIIAVFTLALLAAWPRPSSAGNLDLRIGAFFPRADSNLFREDAALYLRDGHGLKKSDWTGWAGGIAYNSKIANNLEIGVSLDGYGKTLHTSYADYTNDAGGEIRQSLELDVVPLAVSLRMVPTSRRARLAPFVEVGADVVFYEYKEFGDFIDFQSHQDPLPIYSDAFKSSSAAPGFHVAGGLKVAINDDFSVVGQYKYLFAEHDMDEDFSGLRIDLSGGMATLGLNIRF
jgi:opacity protein-like surface antigen